MEDGFEAPVAVPGQALAGMQPIAGLTKALQILTWLLVILAPVTLVLVWATGGQGVWGAFTGHAWGLVATGGIVGAVALAQLIVALVWMHRARSNGQRAHPGGQWGPGWAVGAWFVPFAYLFLGFLVMRDIWHATFHRDAGWDRPDVPGWVLTGWLLWSVPKAIMHVGNMAAGNFIVIGTPQAFAFPGLPLTVLNVINLGFAVVEIVAAVFFLRFVAAVSFAQDPGHAPGPMSGIQA